MNIDTGHLKMLSDSLAKEQGYEIVPPDLATEANRVLAGRNEAFVDMTKPGPLVDWAAKMRQERQKKKAKRKAAKASRKKNRA